MGFDFDSSQKPEAICIGNCVSFCLKFGDQVVEVAASDIVDLD